MKNRHPHHRCNISPLKNLIVFGAVAAFIVLSTPMIIPTSGQTVQNFDGSESIYVEDQMAISHAPAYYEYHADNLGKLNPSFCRNNIVWFECAREFGKEAGIYDFSRYEDEYNNLFARGIEPLGCFIYGWGWWPNNKEVPQEDWPLYYDFVEAFVSHFNETLTYYEMWNEPEIGFWPDSDELFFQFLGNITQLVRENDETAIIVCPPVTGPNIDYVDKMITRFGDDTFDDMFDVFSFHTYCGRAPESLTQRIRDLKVVLDNHGIDDPLWISEVGFSTAVDNDEQIDTMVPFNWEFQAVQVIKVYSQAFMHNISTMFWYCLNDWCDTDEMRGEGRFGLMHCADPDTYQFEFKPGGYAYYTLNEITNGSIYYPHGFNINSPPGGKVWASYFYTPRDTCVISLWSENIGDRCTFQVCNPESGTDLDYELTIYDYQRNSSRIVKDGQDFQFALNSTPWLFEINYTGDLQDEGVSLQPLTVDVNVSLSGGRVALLIIAPIPGLAGLIIIIFKNREGIVR